MIASTLFLPPTGRPAAATLGVRPDAGVGAASFALLIGGGGQAAEAAPTPGLATIGPAASERQGDAAAGKTAPLVIASLPDPADPRWLAAPTIAAADATTTPPTKPPMGTPAPAITAAGVDDGAAPVTISDRTAASIAATAVGASTPLANDGSTPAAAPATAPPGGAIAAPGRKRATLRASHRVADMAVPAPVTTTLDPITAAPVNTPPTTAGSTPPSPATAVGIANALTGRSEPQAPAKPTLAAMAIPATPVAVAVDPAASPAPAPVPPSWRSGPGTPSTPLAIASPEMAPIAATMPTVAAGDAPAGTPTRFAPARRDALTGLPSTPLPTLVAAAADPVAIRPTPTPAMPAGAAAPAPSGRALPVDALPGPIASRVATPTTPSLVAAAASPVPTTAAAALSAPIEPLPIDTRTASVPPMIASVVTQAGLPPAATTARTAAVVDTNGSAGVVPTLAASIATTPPAAIPAWTPPVAAAAPAAAVFADAIHAAGRDRPAIATGGGDSPLFQALALAPSTATDGVVATPRHDQPTLDLRHGDWPGAMIEHIEKLRDAADAADTRIRVVPDALGGIDVALRRSSDGVQVTLTADQPATRAMLAEARPQLTQLAEARGIRLADTQVAGGAGGGAATADSWRQPQGQPAAAPTPRAPAPATLADEDSDLTADATARVA